MPTPISVLRLTGKAYKQVRAVGYTKRLSLREAMPSEQEHPLDYAHRPDFPPVSRLGLISVILGTCGWCATATAWCVNSGAVRLPRADVAIVLLPLVAFGFFVAALACAGLGMRARRSGAGWSVSGLLSSAFGTLVLAALTVEIVRALLFAWSKS